MSNLIMTPGTTRPQDIEHDLESGLVVSRLSGATVDPTSGRVVIRIERGWEIRHGRRRRELGQLHVTGSALNLLANIDPAVGDDPQPEWRLGWCVKNGLPIATGSEAPTILVRQLEVL
jgi:predicted Zn-dependent protease